MDHLWGQRTETLISGCLQTTYVSACVAWQVLLFATGSARLPGEVDMQQWSFSIERLDRPMVVSPTISNGLAAPAMCAKASTCTRTLCLPGYEDAAALARGMEYSLMDGGFGMA